MARVEDTYARDFAGKSIMAWSLGAYNPAHEQVPLHPHLFNAPQAFNKIGAGHWLAFIGISVAMWSAITYPIWSQRN